MAGSGKGSKRKLSLEGRVSPPPLRRKTQSVITQSNLSSFFESASKKPPGRVTWQERAPKDGASCTLLIGKYNPDGIQSQKAHSQASTTKCKIAIFDFDSTLIQTSSGKKFGSDPLDWKWWHPSVAKTLKKLHMDDGYRLSVLTNQAGITLSSDGKIPKSHRGRLDAFKEKVAAVFAHLDLPITILAATEKDIYRKPRTGMWTEMLREYGLNTPGSIDLGLSFFVGDAGGRLATSGSAKDFSCSDRNFADNVGIKFHTPEEFFLRQPPLPFSRAFDPKSYVKVDAAVPIFRKQNDQDIVILCGSPGAGKSTFYWKHLELLQYERVNQDTLKTREKCIKVADKYLSEGKSVVVDNTNAEPEGRSKWIALASKYHIPASAGNESHCKHFPTKTCALMNPEGRAMVPGIAFSTFKSKYRKPELSEGYQDITEVKFQFQGTEEEKSIWTQHWV